MRHRFALLLLGAVAPAGCAAGAYVGRMQPPGDGTPVMFAPGVLSTGDVFTGGR